MKWVTRKNANVDRIACPWLIKRFVDKDAEFLYVPADEVGPVAEREGAIPYDVKGVELGHVDGRCSFESIMVKYKLTDPALMRLAKIVHGADVSADVNVTRESAGLQAIAHGFALAHSERLLEDLSVGDFPENVTSGHGVVEEIFAGLQRAFGMTPRVNFEGQLAADHAILFQRKGDVPARSSVGNIDKNALFRETLVGVRDAVPHPCGVSASGQYDDQH